MSKLNLKFSIDGAEVNADEIGKYIAGKMHFDSEHLQERFAKDATFWIMECVGRKVYTVKAQSEKTRVRKLWISMHPPNFDGYYYCHICGRWVHESEAELDHLIASSIERIDTSEPGWDNKLRMSHHVCNYGKSSSKVKSKTMEIAPPDMES